LGTVASEEQIYDDVGRGLEETLPSTWSSDYDPVRLNLANKFDESVPEYMTCCTVAFMDVSQVNGDPVTSLRETFQSGPVLLPADDYIVTAYLAEADGGNASTYQHCETQLSIPADWTENVLAKFSDKACTVGETYF